MDDPDSALLRARYDQAAAAFVGVVAAVDPDAWETPGLGEWTVRDLAGHTSRSLLTVELYLAAPAATADLPDPIAYFHAIGPALADGAGVTQRGREAGIALGADPAAAVAALAARVLDLVRASPDDAIATTPFGAIRLIDYLPTRTFELTIHTLDLVRATGAARPTGLDEAVAGSLLLAARLASTQPDAADKLLLLAGREELPKNLSVI